MTSEEFLLNSIKATAEWVDLQISMVQALPDEAKIPGFDDGKIFGLSNALSGIRATINIYSKWLSEKNK